MAVYIVALPDVKNTDCKRNMGRSHGPFCKNTRESHCRTWARYRAPEGRNPLPNAMFILEFPSVEQAKAWYNDPAYAELIDLRQGGADADILLVTESLSAPI